jgi:hypothetical protein
LSLEDKVWQPFFKGISNVMCYQFGTVKFEFFCHPGLEPGSRMRSRSLQKAILNAGSRFFARDDKEGTTTQAIHTS